MEKEKESLALGFLWSFLENILAKGTSFIIGIVLARLLTPEEFGLVGTVAIFMAISSAFVDSGFSQAIINKKELSSVDCNTAFWFNITIASVFYLLLYFLAPLISIFYEIKIVESIIRVLGLTLIISSAGLISKTLLIRAVNFKKQMYISLTANCISGLISILLACNGYGVWSLVFQQISFQLISTILLLYTVSWSPKLIFSKDSFRYLYRYGINLLLSGLMFTIFNNIYYAVIGKAYSVSTLGFYTRAEQFNDIGSRNITNIVQRVSFPFLSRLQENKQQLSECFTKILKNTAFVSIPIILGISALSEPIIILLLGEKWRGAVWMLQLLCFSGMFHPLINLNLNIFKVVANTKLFMHLEVFRNVVLNILNILISFHLGVKSLLIGHIIVSIIAYIINCFYSSIYTNYTLYHQLRDIVIPLLGGLILHFILLFLNKMMIVSYTLLAFELLFCLLYFIIILRIFNRDLYSLILSRIKSLYIL